MNEWQYIYLYMDDSGKLSEFEPYSVYAGIILFSNKELDQFTNKYRHIINEIKCNYCTEEKGQCSRKCPEIKSCKLSDSQRRRIINLAKKYTTFGILIDNSKVKDFILGSKAAKGRFTDYCHKELIKDVFNYLISNKHLDPNKDVRLILNFDEQPLKSNGYYTLRESLFEELLHGIINHDYSTVYSPVLHNNLEITLHHLDSSKNYPIQMADILAGTLRHQASHYDSNFDPYKIVTVYKFMP